MEKNKDSTNTWMNLNVTNMCVLIGIALTLGVYLCICVSVFCSKNPMPKQSPENIQQQKTWKIPMFSGQRHKSSKEVIIFLACLLIVPVRKSLRDSSCLFHIGDGQISLQCHNTKKDQDQRIFEPGRWDRWDAIGLYAKLDALPSRCFFQVSKCQPQQKKRVKNRCDIKKKACCTKICCTIAPFNCYSHIVSQTRSLCSSNPLLVGIQCICQNHHTWLDNMNLETHKSWILWLLTQDPCN